jgi:hypothetical protein
MSSALPPSSTCGTAVLRRNKLYPALYSQKDLMAAGPGFSSGQTCSETRATWTAEPPAITAAFRMPTLIPPKFLLRHLPNPNAGWDSRPSIPHHGGMTRDICVQFSKRVPDLRKERGWRQLDLVEQAGISKNLCF